LLLTAKLPTEPIDLQELCHMAHMHLEKRQQTPFRARAFEVRRTLTTGVRKPAAMD